jgi:hypothetical protein
MSVGGSRRPQRLTAAAPDRCERCGIGGDLQVADLVVFWETCSINCCPPRRVTLCPLCTVLEMAQGEPLTS